MKSFFVSVGVLLTAILAAASATIGYAIVTAFVSLALGGPVMVGFAIASSTSDGLIPALGYLTSSAIIYIVLVPAGFMKNGLAKQKTG